MKKIVLLFLMVLPFISCEDYLEGVNEDQSNRSEFEKVAPNQMLAGAINNYHRFQAVTLADFGNKLANIYSLNSGYTSSDAAYFFTFTSSDYATIFNTLYTNGDNFQDILDKKSKFPNYSYHFAVAKLFRVMSFDYLTALYGDVPYSQAFNDNILYPKYDDDKAIIPQLFAELDEARNYINNADPDSVVELGAEDIVFGGNTDKWLQLINTVELRLLMRLSKTTDASLVTLRTNRFASLPVDFISDDVVVNPGYDDSACGRRNPIYNSYGLECTNDAWTSTNRSNAHTKFFVQLLAGQTTYDTSISNTSLSDPRRTRITTGSTSLPGAEQGVFPLTPVARISSFYHGYTGTDADNAIFNATHRDGYLILKAEADFLLAEAIERGYLAGDAATEFSNGITSSFAFYSKPLPAATLAPLLPASYLTAISSRSGLGYAASANKIQPIIVQKYIALANWSGIEPFLDHLRTGFPNIPMPVGVTQTNKPKRLVYPSSEYSNNSENVPNVTNAELFTVNSKTPYYLQ